MDKEQLSKDEFYMMRAISLAEKGTGHTAPNPMVGCVIVKDGEIISEDYHHKCGEFHAERNAILNCPDKSKLEGATIYVTLEPCCHHGKTPPCTDIITEYGFKRAVIGCVDDNPLVYHKGIEILKNHGIEVTTNVLEKECRKLNEVFFHYIKHKTPFVAMKYAMTADGKIASFTGHSKYITGEEAREHVHSLRNRYTAIMAGIGTVIADDPMLDCRNGGRNPIRIICDTNLNIPLSCRIAATAKEIRTIIACGDHTEKEKCAKLAEYGIEIVKLPLNGEHIDFSALMSVLGDMGIDSILLEGGGTLNFSAVKCGAVNKVYQYIAPKIVGGREAKTPVEGSGFPRVDECLDLRVEDVKRFGKDVLIVYECL